MRFIEAVDYEDMSQKAARILAAQIIMEPDCVFGLATGDSPLGAYRLLAEWRAAGVLDFSRASAFNLDEYRGLGPDSPQSYRFFMEENLFSKINMLEANRFIPDGLAGDPDAECARYEAAIDGRGGIDIQLLGIGNNGHIGFNEPSDEFKTDTHLTDLTKSTIDANSRFFEQRADVPVQAYTMGIRTIMRARKVLLIVSGERKAEIAERAFFSAVTPQVPASILQLHGDATVVGDAGAFSLIRRHIGRTGN